MNTTDIESTTQERTQSKTQINIIQNSPSTTVINGFAPETDTKAPKVSQNQTNVQSSGEVGIQMESESEVHVNHGYIVEPKGAFSDPVIRNAFIKKVYGILSTQILFTVVCVGVVITLWVEIIGQNPLNTDSCPQLSRQTQL